MNQTKMYKLIRTWEYDVGESFFDYNESIIQPMQLIFYLLGRGYINKLMFNYWTAKNIISYFDIFYDCDVNDGHTIWCDKDLEYPYDDFITTWILSELIVQHDIYIERVKKTFKDHKVAFEIIKDGEESINEEIKNCKKIMLNKFILGGS